VTSAFGLALQAAGLTGEDAAELLGVTLDAVKSWSSGRREAPAEAWEKLRDWWEWASKARLAMVAKAAKTPPGWIEIGMPTDLAEAQGVGFLAMEMNARQIGLLALEVKASIRVVPRGSTIATAAAADQHDRARRKMESRGRNPGKPPGVPKRRG
jgi:hypothetical protein